MARLIARCTCGKVDVEAAGVPIVSAVCYCDDCQAGARQIEALPNARRVRAPDGGVGYLVYRPGYPIRLLAKLLATRFAVLLGR